MMTRIAIVLAFVVAAPALAQSGPSFDCAKASSVVERTICKEPELAKADRALASAYSGLLGRLDAAARGHFQNDQLRWIANRDRGCDSGFIEPAQCLSNRYKNRLARIAMLGRGPYPFVSEQAIVRKGKVKATRYEIDASYPQFDGASVNFAAVNRLFAEGARTGAADAVPAADIGPDIDQTWSYDQDFELHRPVADAICVQISAYTFTGGAHGNGGSWGTLVDTKSGRIAQPADVFVQGDEWRGALRDLVTVDLKKQFVERPGFDDALDPAKLDKQLREPGRYVWQADKLSLIFNQYDVAAYVMGRYVVEIRYSRIKSLLRPDGPLGTLR